MLCGRWMIDRQVAFGCFGEVWVILGCESEISNSRLYLKQVRLSDGSMTGMSKGIRDKQIADFDSHTLTSANVSHALNDQKDLFNFS